GTAAPSSTGVWPRVPPPSRDLLSRSHPGGGCEALLEIREDVLDALEPHREADEALAHAGLRERVAVELRLRRRGRVDDEGADVADVRDVRVELERIDERDRGVEAARDVEAQDRARALRQVGLPQLVPGAGGVARELDPLHLCVAVQEVDDLLRVLHVAL